MKANQNSAHMAGAPPSQPETEIPAPRIYDCTGCRFSDSHGLICDVCLRKILDGQAGQRKASLIAACFDRHGMTLLRGRSTVLV